MNDNTNTTNQFSRQLDNAITAIDKFVASFFATLHQIDSEKEQSDTAFDKEMNKTQEQCDAEFYAEKKRFNAEKAGVDDRLRQLIAAIDNDLEEIRRQFRLKIGTIDGSLEEKRGQLERAIADIDKDVESHLRKGVDAIDSELKAKQFQANLDVSTLCSKISSLKYSKDEWPEKVKVPMGWISGGCGCLLLLALFGGGGASAVLVCGGGWAGLAALLFAPYALYFILQKAKEGNKERIQTEFDEYAANKAREKQGFIERVHVPYKARKEQEKDEYRKKMLAYQTKRGQDKEKYRQNMSMYEAAKQSEKDALPSKFKYDDQVRQLQSRHSDNTDAIFSNHGERISRIEARHQERLAELARRRKEIFVNFAGQFNDNVTPLKIVCKEIQIVQPLLCELSENHLNRTANIPDFLALGQSRISTELPEGFQAKEWSKDVPYLVKFPFDKPLFGQYSATSVTEDKTVCDDYLIRDLLLRLLFIMPVGMLQITAIDPLKMGKTLDIFSPILDIEKLVPGEKFLTLSDEMEASLKKHSDYVEQCIQKRFRGSMTDWVRYNDANKEHPLPYKVLCVFGFPEQFSDKSIVYLKRILEHGLQCGVLPIVTVGTIDDKVGQQRQKAAADIRDWLYGHAEPIGSSYLPQLERLTITADRSEPFVPLERLEDYMQWIHAEYKGRRQSEANIDKLWAPEDCWSETSVEGVSVPLGKSDDGKKVLLHIGDDAPHFLIAGGTGAGKSNMIHVILHGLAHNYAPEELNVYLLDCKGVEYEDYAERIKDDNGAIVPSLPHVRLVTLRVDVEYCITVLNHLVGELDRRKELFRTFRDYRKKEHLPRILLFIDEFQALFQDDQATANTAQGLLNKLLRLGRSAGIHVLCATQTLSGLNSKINFEELKRNLVGRIALACDQSESFSILASNNDAASKLKKERSLREGILNTSSGDRSGNAKFVIPYAKPELCVEHQKFLAEKSAEMPKDIKIFEGSRLPRLPSPKEFEAFRGENKRLTLVPGEEFNYDSNPFLIDWEQKRRKNLCIAGADEAIRNGLLYSLLSSVNGRFERIIYFNLNPHFEGLDLPVTGLEIKRYDWDADIAEMVDDFKDKKTLLIIDPMEEAEVFQPPEYQPPKEGTSAFLFKQLLENASLHGSYVVAFAENWQTFKKRFKSYLELFELRIGFQLNVTDAADLTGNAQFKGLDNRSRAVFSHGTQQVLFRPFVVPTGE